MISLRNDQLWWIFGYPLFTKPAAWQQKSGPEGAATRIDLIWASVDEISICMTILKFWVKKILK